MPTQIISVNHARAVDKLGRAVGEIEDLRPELESVVRDEDSPLRRGVVVELHNMAHFIAQVLLWLR